MATGAPSEDVERRRDKLSLRRKEGRTITDPYPAVTGVEKDEQNIHEVSVPVTLTTLSHDKSYAEGDNR